MVETYPQTPVRHFYTGGADARQLFLTAPSPESGEAVSFHTRGTAIDDHFAAIRAYAGEHHLSVLELIAEYALDDLPVSVGNMIKDYLEEHKPKVKPGEVKYRGLFSSGRSDLSARMEEIIYGIDPFQDSDEGDDE